MSELEDLLATMLEFDGSKDIIECGQKVAEEDLPTILAGLTKGLRLRGLLHS